MLKDYEYLDFEIKKEGWNEYEIEDGTQLKAKFVLIKILRKKAPEGYEWGYSKKGEEVLLRKKQPTYTERFNRDLRKA